MPLQYLVPVALSFRSRFPLRGARPMSNPSHRVLLVEEPGASAIAVAEALRQWDERVRVLRVDRSETFDDALEEGGWTVVVAALDTPGVSGRAVLNRLRLRTNPPPLVLVADEDTWAVGLPLVRDGAETVVLRGDLGRLRIVLERLTRARGEAPPEAGPSRLGSTERFFRAVLDQVADGVVVIDETGRVAHMNAAATALLGLRQGDAIGLDAKLLFPAGWTAGPGDEGRVSAEATGRRPDGSAIPLEVAFTELHAGASRFSVGTLRDLGPTRVLEAELQHAQRLEALALLADGLANSFNNILTGLLTYVSVIRRDLGEAHPSVPDLEEVERQADRAVALVRQLRTLSRRPRVAQQEVQMGELVSRATAFLGWALGDSYELLVESTPGLPRVLADPSQVEQVLHALCIHARGLLPDGGTIRVRARLATFPASQPGPGGTAGSYVELSVLGERSAHAGRASAGGRVPPPAWEGADADALGLPVAHGILRQHGGYLEMHQPPGEALELRAGFPAGPAQPVISETRPAELVHQGTETVLLAEDDVAVRTIVERVLTNHGYTVVAASDGEDVVARFRAEPERYAMAILDVLMPRLGGLDAGALLREQRPGLPILWMSAFTGGFAIPLEGPTDFLPKPFPLPELTRRVRSLLDHAFVPERSG